MSLRLLVSSALASILMLQAPGAFAAAAARVNARADELTETQKKPAKSKKSTEKVTPFREKTDEKTTAKKPASKDEKAVEKASSKTTAKKSTMASKSKSDDDKTTAKSSKASGSKKADAASKKVVADKSSTKKTDAKATTKKPAARDDEKVVATSSSKGTLYVTPDKDEKYANRKTGNLVSKADEKPAPKPVAKASPPVKAVVLSADADKAVNQLFEADPKPTVQTVAHNVEAPKPEPKLDLPSAPIPYTPSVKPDAAPQPKVDLAKVDVTPQPVDQPESKKDIQVADVAPLPVKAAEVKADLKPEPKPEPQIMPPVVAVAPKVVPQDVPPVPVKEVAPVKDKVLVAVKVDAYGRDYEGQQTGSETRYDSGIRAGLASRQSQMSALEGNWMVSSLTGDRLVSLALRGAGAQKLEGAWRSLQGGVGMNRSGFVSDVVQAEDRLMIDYQAASAKGQFRLDLRKEPDGRWRGQMIDPNGAATPVVMSAQ
ncbi:hypothetical protein PQU92_04985 [Asticcacaulis sp. BYS171W]|uniref:Uncharacterized protein n=1 Tax=Asticcacaulis aquaticus TaxID=2984212 RepID=A0ABT5HRC0_9CAUL|nr:hypothetical protein [Asticcacaulis aquaticus]MDC7682618.1 hypothetical protein [Asticcacaulis aquaticus]